MNVSMQREKVRQQVYQMPAFTVSASDGSVGMFLLKPITVNKVDESGKCVKPVTVSRFFSVFILPVDDKGLLSNFMDVGLNNEDKESDLVQLYILCGDDGKHVREYAQKLARMFASGQYHLGMLPITVGGAGFHVCAELSK